MSEETTNTATQTASSERAGFCQDCGKPLTRETVRVVGTGVFCEPCLATRIGAVPSGYATGAEAEPRPGAPQPVQAQGGQPGASQPGGGWNEPWNPGSGSGSAGGPGNPGGPAHPGNPGAPGSPSPGFTSSPSTHLPNPTLAGLLGIIPGVGAMYNGQFVKGLVHFAIFAVLVVLSNDVSGIFGLFSAGWIFYQIFDAYHTARARRDGTPLPNLFGINDLADRIGSGQGFGTYPGGPGQAPGNGPAGYGYTASTSPVPPPPSAPAWDWKSTSSPSQAPVPPGTPHVQSSYGVPPANWAGYAHPSTFAAPSPPPPPIPGYPAYAGPSPTETAEQIKAQAYRDAGLGTPSYTEATAGSNANWASSAPVPFTPAPRRFPMGALWLIALGVLVLVGNLSSEWRISGLWVLAGLFASLAVWTLVRRLEWAGGYSAVMDGHFPRLAGMLRAPIMLLTLSIMFLLQAAHLATFGQTWPVFPIAFGVALLLERTVGAAPIVPLPPVGGFYGAAGSPGSTAVTPVAEPAPSSSTDVRS